MTHREMAVVDEEELQGVVRSIREGAKERWRASFVCVRARSDLLKAAPVALHFFALRTLALGEHHALLLALPLLVLLLASHLPQPHFFTVCATPTLASTPPLSRPVAASVSTRRRASLARLRRSRFASSDALADAVYRRHRERSASVCRGERAARGGLLLCCDERRHTKTACGDQRSQSEPPAAAATALAAATCCVVARGD